MTQTATNEVSTPATTNEVATPATAATTAKPKRGIGAKGMNVFPCENQAAAEALAKEKGDKFDVYIAREDGKPDRYFASNHRNAVQNKVLDMMGITIGGLRSPTRKVSPEKAKTVTESFIASLDDKARAELFAKFMKGGATDLIADAPQAAKRNDTSPEFAAAEAESAKSAKAAKPAIVNASAGKTVAKSGKK